MLSFPASAAFSKRKVESQANQAQIAEALRLVTGQAARAPIRAQRGSGIGRRQLLESLLSEEDAIAAFKTAFDAEDVRIEGDPRRETS